MVFLILLLLSALFISGVAAFFAVTGLMATFPGAMLGAALMGLSMEIGKLMSVSFTYRFWDKLNFFVRSIMVVFIFVLSMITSIGIFGYLSRANVEGIQGLDVGTDQIAIVDTRIANEQQNIVMQQTHLASLDAPINLLLADTSQTERAIQLRYRQRVERAAVAASIDSSSKRIATLQEDRATLNIGQQQVEADVGPIKYLSQLIFGSETIDTLQKAVRVLILLLISVFDPLAIALVFAANMQINENRKNKLVKEQAKADATPKSWDPATVEPETAEPPKKAPKKRKKAKRALLPPNRAEPPLKPTEPPLEPTVADAAEEERWVHFKKGKDTG